MAARGRERAKPARGQRPATAATAPLGTTHPPPPLWIAIALFVALLAVYSVNFRLRGSGDSLPTRLLPFSILGEGDVDLDEFTWERTAAGRLPYYVHARDAHIYSVSTLATAFVVTPLYVVPAWWLAANDVGYNDVRARVLIVVMERCAAALLAALSTCLLFSALCRLTSWRWALALALVYALGTSTWSISSQALWPHALAQLTLVILCRILIDPRPSNAGLVVAGVAAALAVANRPQMFIFAALAFAFVCVRWRRRALVFAAAPALVGVALLAYNRAVFSNVAGGYGGFQHFDGPLLTGLAGLFVSPNRGLLVFTPIMAFGLWGAVQVWRTSAPPWLRWLTVGVALHVIAHAAFTESWAGYTYGPRYMTDVLPALTLFLVYGLVPLCRVPAVAVGAVLLALYGVGVQAIGVYAADEGWNREPVPLELAPQRIWDWSDLQIVRSARNGFRGGELAPVMRDAFLDPIAAQVEALEPYDLRAMIRAPKIPPVMEAGAHARVWLRVRNDAKVAWPAFNGESMITTRYLVFLVIRWFAGGEPVPGVGDVIPLPENVAPGQRVDMRIDIAAPARSGDYELELRVSQSIDGASGVVGPGALRVPMRVE